ncbi:hypothetical protein GCM10009785_17540 [Brooklawnia cerclae]|uniref:Exopolysaccharide biosynthesis protein n=1 Tax=Brooklawnia cerclae TaxID=349934 RepID=A0ABX0SIE1_9ACTN|nr:phosphodiester glycosidase family protein [Brooklawnia cerclae]NIH57674.1 exopolysaccharide biosynthesis protein [Brooklawnia cerclae]
MPRMLTGWTHSMATMNPDTSSSVTPADQPESATQATATATRSRPRWRRVVVATVLAVLLLLGGGAAWALNRFVVQHVEITDVTAYEAERAGAESSASDDDSADEADDTGTSGTSEDDASASPQVTITTHTYGEGDQAATYYVADIVVSDVTQLRAAFADNAFGQNIVANTSSIAADNNALLAINGDYYGFRDTGIVIRNGVLYRDEGAREGLAIYSDGTMAVYDETATSGEQLLADGVWQTLSFGPALVDDGEIVDGIDQVEVDTNIGNHSIQGDQPRTAIGMIEANHFVFVVVDGRSDDSAGVSVTELAEIMQSLGATEAYNLDGGGSSTMVYEDGLVNDPLGKGQERGTSDILYIVADEG